tara:strand:- start:273 stop:443 length:171 start_codon:yes stop_codon:yes gene_type:complete
MKKFLLFLFLISCTTHNSNYNVNKEVLDFDKDLTFEQFNILLIKYAKRTPYPNIDD